MIRILVLEAKIKHISFKFGQLTFGFMKMWFVLELYYKSFLVKFHLKICNKYSLLSE